MYIYQIYEEICVHVWALVKALESLESLESLELWLWQFFQGKTPQLKGPQNFEVEVCQKSAEHGNGFDPRNLHSVRGFPSHVWWNQRLPGSQLWSAKRWHCSGTSCVSLVDHLRQGHASLQDAEKTANELTDIELGIVWSELRRDILHQSVVDFDGSRNITQITHWCSFCWATG